MLSRRILVASWQNTPLFFTTRPLCSREYYSTAHRLGRSIMSEAWLKRVATEPLSANYIPSLNQATQQVLWIGCSDSNPKETNVLNLLGEELLVLRNLGNIIIDGDLSSETMIKHAVVDLEVAIDPKQFHSLSVLTLHR